MINNNSFMTSNVLKVLAIVAMIVDHTTVWLVESSSDLETVLRAFGRTAAPIMCFLITEGYYHTSDNKKYMQRLFVFALISHFPYVLYFGLEWWQGTSVIWGLFLGLVALTIFQSKNKSMFLKICAVILCCLFAWTADWNYIAVFWVLAFGIFRNNPSLRIISFTLIGLALYIIPGLYQDGTDLILRFGILFVVPLLLLYNGQRGRKSFILKWSFYIIYPLHFIILYILRYYIFV